MEEESNLFMAHSPITDVSNGVWFIDSGCSNHMSSSKSLFRDLDETKKSQVRFGDNSKFAWKETVQLPSKLSRVM